MTQRRPPPLPYSFSNNAQQVGNSLHRLIALAGLRDNALLTTLQRREFSAKQEFRGLRGRVRRFGYVFRSNRGTTLRLGSVLKWGLYPLLDALKIPRCGMHAFRHGRVSYLVYAGVSRAVIRDWIGHSSDAMIDLYTKKLGQFHAAELAKVLPLLDSSWTQANKEEKDDLLQSVVN
jgi:integrase